MILNGKAPSPLLTPRLSVLLPAAKTGTSFLSILLEIVMAYSSILLYILHTSILKKNKQGHTLYHCTAPCLPSNS